MLNIRYKIFETNSSSTHSIIMCTDEDYKKLRAGELMIAGWENPIGKYHEFVSRAKLYEWFWNEYYPQNKEYLESNYGVIDPSNDLEAILDEEDIAYTFENFGGEEYEWYDTSFTTPGGETVHAFGYYGNDW